MMEDLGAVAEEAISSAEPRLAKAKNYFICLENKKSLCNHNKASRCLFTLVLKL